MRVSAVIARAVVAIAAFGAAGCALYNDVIIQPLIVRPQAIERGTSLPDMVAHADYLRALELGVSVDQRTKKSGEDLAALGAAELAAGRYDRARRHLRAALDTNLFHTTYADVAWQLSQLEYLTNNFEASREWATISVDHGMAIKDWHLHVLDSLADVQAYKFSGSTTEQLSMKHEHPDIPRIDVRVNRTAPVSAVIDTGAVTTIVSEGFAKQAGIRLMGSFDGIFLGLLGEPIPVHFGIIDRLQLGEMTVENIPVAVMADKQMSFFTGNQKVFRIEMLLGAALLKEFRMELDFRHHQVTLTRLTDADRHPVADQNLFIQDFQPYLRGTINAQGWFMFVLDTGSEVTFLNDSKLLALPLKGELPKMHGALLQGLGGSKKHGSKLSGVEIGADKWSGIFRTLPTYTTEQDHSIGIIGENFLQHFKVIIDFGRMRVDLIRVSGL